jgi:hypothetical protein
MEADGTVGPNPRHLIQLYMFSNQVGLLGHGCFPQFHKIHPTKLSQYFYHGFIREAEPLGVIQYVISLCNCGS